MLATSDGKRLSALDRWLRPVEDSFNLIAALAIFLLMLLGVTQIALRKLFNAPIVGYIDAVELSMATFAFLGAAYCQRLGDHIRMEIVIGLLKGRALWWAELVSTVAALAIVAVLVWFGWEHFLRSFLIGDTTIDAEYPVWPSKLLVPVAFFVWFLRLLVQFIGFLRLVKYPDAEPVAVPVMLDAAAHAQIEIRDALGTGLASGDDGRDDDGRDDGPRR